MQENTIGVSGGEPLAARPEVQKAISQLRMPPSTRRKPIANIDRMWLSGVSSGWPIFRDAAIDWLAIRPGPTAVNLLLFDDRSLNEEFTLPKSEIRRKILKVRKSADVQNVYHFFILGKEVGKGATQESILRITRREMLQLYIMVYARKYLIWKDFETRAPDVSDDESKFFAYIDRMMREKPFGGGPLLNVR